MRRSEHGFTLIELLIVVVIIGILATIAIPKFASTKEQAQVSRMRTDLRNLAVAQESYFADAQTYYNGAIPNPALLFSPGTGVTVALSNVSSTGWAATASMAVTTRTCVIYYGTGGPLAPATGEGKVACT